MKIREAIKHIMEEASLSYAELGEKLGISRQSIWNSLNGKATKSVAIEQAVKVCEIAGYKMMLVPDDVKKPTGAIEITNE